MIRAILPIFIALSFVGCGPMQMPMAHRLDEEAQHKVDQTWENTLTPSDRFDHQTLLDIFVVSNLYQYGVDKLSFRSEKKTANGLVIMEIAFDRARPAEDRFEVTVQDAARKVVRKERYNRDEVEKTLKDLLDPRLPPEQDGVPDPPEIAAERAKLKTRLNRVKDVIEK